MKLLMTGNAWEIHADPSGSNMETAKKKKVRQVNTYKNNQVKVQYLSSFWKGEPRITTKEGTKICHSEK